MKDKRIRKKVVELTGKLSKELTRLSSKKVNSRLRDCSVGTLEELTWDSLLQEVGTEAPVMLSLLRECIHVFTNLKQKEEGVPVVCPVKMQPSACVLLFCYVREVYG